MMYTETTITYLDALKAELADYERRIEKARALLHDQPEYYALVLKGLEYSMGVVRAKIEREEQKAIAT